MDNFKISSVYGGGSRGDIVLAIHERIDEFFPGWIDGVDFHAGTSTGALIAGGYCAGLTTLHIRQIYHEKIPVILEKTLRRDCLNPHDLFTAKYEVDKFIEAVWAELGSLHLFDLTKKIMVSAYHLDPKGMAIDSFEKRKKSKFYHNFPGSDSDEQMYLADVILQSGVAPINFSAYIDKIFGSVGVDGGVADVNPSMSAIALTQDERNDEKIDLLDVRCLSFSTGLFPSVITDKRNFLRKAYDWGTYDWAVKDGKVFSVMVDADGQNSHYQTKAILGTKRYHQVLPVLDAPLSGESLDFERMQEIANNFDLKPTLRWMEDNWFD